MSKSMRVAKKSAESVAALIHAVVVEASQSQKQATKDNKLVLKIEVSFDNLKKYNC